MGAVVSNWQPPENDEIKLTKQDIIDIVGKENFIEDKYIEYAGDNDWITVAEFKLCMGEYAAAYLSSNLEFPASGAVDDEDVEEKKRIEIVKEEEETYDGSYEDDTGSYEDTTLKTGDDNTAGGVTTKEPTVTGGETRTSAGDDFSESVLPAPTIVKLNDEEMDVLRLETADLQHQLFESRVEGVYPPSKRAEVARFRECLASMYEQTKEPYLQGPTEISEGFVADYYHVLDCDLTTTRSVARYYEADSTFNFVGIPDVIGRRPISRAIVKKFAKLQVRHAVKSVEIDESPPNMCMYLLTCSSLLMINNDSPRRIMEIFYIKERDDELKKAKYGPFYIFRQILVVQDSRPLYTWAETKLRPGCRDNWDESLEKPSWLVARAAGGTVGELTADDEAGSGDGSYSGSDRDAESGSESGSDDEDGDSVSAAKKGQGGGDGLQTVKEEASMGGSMGAGSATSSVVSATILKPRKLESGDDVPDDVSAMSGSAY